MPTVRDTGVVVYRARAGIDGIDEYSRRLVRAMAGSGTEARYIAEGPASALVAARGAPWVLLQYNPFVYGRAGFAPQLLPDVERLRRRARGPLAVMVHEAWVNMTDAKSTLIGVWQRAQLRTLLRLADGVMTSTEVLAREIGHGAVHVPIGANIEPIATSHKAARAHLGLEGKLSVALFGRGNPSRALDYAEAAIAALAAAHGADRLVVLNLGADAPAVRVPAGVTVHRTGELPPDELSVRLWASDLVLLPFTDGLSTRRGTMMAALAHGRSVVGLRGRSTDAVLADARDALTLTPVGDRDSFSRAAVELASDPDRLRAIGEAGRRLYESRFAWPVLAANVAAQLENLTARRRCTSAGTGRVVFVAHEVGGSGGMERQSERLVGGLLHAGRPVTVISRSCSIPDSAGLRFVRVRTPRRPVSLGYPAFFVVASLLGAAKRDGLLHTTGAIVANRADLSTVHYCHRAAATRVNGSRASRADPFYLMNAAVSRIASLAGETWCYRPARTRLLCAVSQGVAAELREQFPEMARTVRTVPNGVDCAVFRPERESRTEMRAELGVGDRESLALFVGGDWERKGLTHAVDALALSPGWHLAVAGKGDPASHAARARAAGTEPRLHFLGPVRDMPCVYPAGDAFVLPTGYEAFPLVALEAAASGLPLLVTRVNGVEDLLEDGVNGWYIAPDARDIARRLNELRQNPGHASQLGVAARSAASRFSWDAMVEGYLSLYGELRA
jgi:glycosyltransferase involved in cell wall biosynthesis